ncbi:MAG TPA: prolyl oligopeptidase family serine peptidase [Bryobacteraceae bacterium]|nr:prolyl oligopeptidase family serine peptidase [Bryobacteraceae bacterium]
MFRFALWLWAAVAAAQTSKPLMTLDEFFDAVEIRGVKISPDGHAVAIETLRADWDANRFRSDLWLYREDGAGSLVQLTRSGHDHGPQWSPDGRSIAFLSDRKGDAETDQVWAIAASGGDAFAVTRGEEKVHAFAWSGDASEIYFATRTPWTKEREEAYKKDWKDVVEFREAERGDAIARVEIGSGAVKQMAATPWRVKQMETSPDGRSLAFLTDSVSERQEAMDAYGIYVVDTAAGGEPRKVMQRQAVLDSMQWASESRHIYFSFTNGSVEGNYQDAQPRLYWVDTQSAAGRVTRWAKFPGEVTGYTATQDGLLIAGRLGTEVQVYREDLHLFVKQPGRTGTYAKLSAAARASRVAFVHSSLTEPPEVYLGEDVTEARAITTFNRRLAERALPEGRPYRWTAEDGTTVEGMLIYPPGKTGEKNLRMLTLIHGGPADADGNHFEADWYQWGSMAATRGWLVFEPNYRGSTGYGDAFALGIIPNIVSKPGKDIVDGIDALVKDGIADPDNLTVGGYSYGGFLTNWLITQTTRFKAAVTGAGAVEHVANWGNDDTTYDDAYFLGGLPWDMMKNYNDEAAIWQMNKVKTPTHIVAGAEDVRVYVGEQYLLERALHTQGVPVKLLIFPGEGHELDKNPWHGKIKVREELKWIEGAGK